MKLTNRKAASILCEFYGRIILTTDISVSSDEAFAFQVAVKALYFGTTRTHEEESIKLINETINTLTRLVGELVIRCRVEINDQELEAFRLAIKTLEECKASQDEKETEAIK